MTSDVTRDGGNDAWTACAPGTLAKFSRQAKMELGKRGRGRRVFVGAGSVAALSLAVGLGWLATASPDRIQELPPYGGLTCREVLRDLEAYLADDFDATRRRQIDRHLLDCRHCRRRLDAALHARGIAATSPEESASIPIVLVAHTR